MIISLVLIEGTDVDEQDLGISLGNAKQIVVGRAYGFGIGVWIWHNSAYCCHYSG
jgi:hypothetical protein